MRRNRFMTRISTTPNQGIKEYRQSHGISRQDLVESLGIPYRTLISWETGYRKAPPYEIRLLKMYIDRMVLQRDAADSERNLYGEERIRENS